MMKHLNILFTLAILVTIFACGGDSNEINPPSPNGERSWSFNGGPLIGIDTLSGQINSDYDASSTINGAFGGQSYAERVSLTIFLFDEDPNSFPFTNNGSFPISDEAPIRAILSYSYFRDDKSERIEATSGSVTVTKFDRVRVSNQDFIQISGTFDVSDGNENLTGTFNNIRMRCLECE